MSEDPLTPPERLAQDWQVFRRYFSAGLNAIRAVLFMRIWREVFTLRFILGWGFIAFWLATALAMLGADTVLGLQSLITYTEMCFIVAAFLLLAKFTWIAIAGDYPFWERALFTLVLFGLVGVGIVELIRALEKHRPQSAATREQEQGKPETLSGSPAESTASGALLPIVFDVAVTWDKQLHFGNFGEVPIYDVQVRITEYVLSYKAFAQERLEIEFYTKHGGKPDFHTPGKLEPKHRSGPFDLKQKVKFVNFPKNEDKVNRPDMVEWIRKIYALRVTFRDDRNGLKYVAYKVTGSIIGFAIFENKETEGETGGVSRDFIQQIPSFIIAHQKQLYGLADNEREYVLSP